MSAKKRRRKAKIKYLQKLDANHLWLYLLASPRRDGHRAMQLWWGCVVPLGDKLERQKPGAWHSLPRHPSSPDILMYNFHKRNPKK